MRNVKKELLDELVDKSKIKCAIIKHDEYCWLKDSINKTFMLKLNYTEDDLESFYNELDFEYDGGYGTQLIYGTVWLEDGSWLERGEYDGSEWWEHKFLPPIPNELIN